VKAAQAEAGPVCRVCGDTGWVTTGPDDRVARCRCFLEARVERLVASAKIPDRYSGCELESYRVEGNPSLAAAKVSATRFVEQYPVDKTGLLFEGSIGIGKTHLAVATIKELMRQKGITCLFCDYRELLKSIQNSYNSAVQATELGLLQPVFDAEVLLLDELGAVKPTEWVWDTVSFILNTRYNDKRTTLITTNLMDGPAIGTGNGRSVMRADTLGDRIGERMRSRLHEMCRIVQMEGADFRQSFRSAANR
jgi:DNA replication protein DnaC